jgi:KDO2-lipid IV(A) lauroyltransferase
MPPARQAGFWKRQRYRLDAGVLFALSGLLRRFGIDRATAIGAWFGRTVLAPLGRNSRNTIETLRTAYPSLDDEQVRAMLTASYENLGRIIAEIALLDRFAAPEAWLRFSVSGLEHLEAARAQGKGMIIATGHFSNWEIVGIALHHLKVPFSAVTRPPNNPWVAAWIEKKRAGMGTHRQIPKGSEGTRQLFSALRQGEPVVMLIDQHLAEGIPVPLFGKEAMTTHAPATLAGKLDIPVLPMSVRRGEGSHFEVIFYPPLRYPRTGNDARDVLEMTTELNRFVEGEVRARPGHWLWMHRRWKPVATLSRRASRMVGETEPTGQG